MKSDRDVVILSYARTPFGRFGGALKDRSAIELATMAIAEALRKSEAAPADVEMVYAGVGMIGAGVLTPARQALLLGSGLRETTPSLAVDRACCSGMTAVGLAYRDIRNGDADLIVCGGFESLSNTPFLWPRQRGARPGPVAVSDPLLLRADFLDKAIAAYTGEEALRAGIDRAAQDEWALASHQRYFAAQAEGYFEGEIFPVGEVSVDESPRADASREKLSTLKTVYGSPTVTPGNAPGLNDGAAFLVLASRRFAESRGAEPLAQIIGYAQVADGPTTGTSTPAKAILKLLDRSGLTPGELARIEINEAFAATPLVSTLRLAKDNPREAEVLRARTNVAGGAVAIGHPLGASGARLVMTLANGLRRQGGGLGTAAICGGYGQGDALLLSVD
ncbi:thiolase family protein [Rhodoligotrophos defluvii]|uniref:thiolase family protein n=1 Tax=Rhodoligotrophos defluvii TaxID=2561934 RepID=UPI001484D09F|nr:thiolase family protein [Rhodoligotrophos defluvii]